MEEEFTVTFTITKGQVADTWNVTNDDLSYQIENVDPYKNVWAVTEDDEFIGYFKTLATALGEAIIMIGG